MKTEGQHLSSRIVYTCKYVLLIPPAFCVLTCFELFLFAWITLCAFYRWFTIFGALSFCSAVLIILSPCHHTDFLHLLIACFKLTWSPNFKAEKPVLCLHLACFTVALKQSYLLSLGDKSCQMILTLWKEDKSLKLFSDFINTGSAALNKHVLCLI